MRKRTQDGYVLVFVLVVILVVLALCGVACTAAMRNLKSQQASIEDLQSKLNAAGEVEKIYGALANVKTDPITLTGRLETKWEAARVFATDICTKAGGNPSESTYDLDDDTLILWIPVSSTGDDSNAQVDALLRLEATLSGEESPDPEPTETPADPGSEQSEEKYITKWTLTGVKVSYDSYHVSTAEGEGDSP